MSAPQSRLNTELDHTLGNSLLADAILEWRPTSNTQQQNLLEETLAHARAASNVLTNICAHRAVGMEDGSVVQDICDAWDLYGLADLLSSLLEVTTIVSRRRCPDRAEEPEAIIDRLWLAGGDGNGHWADARVKGSDASQNGGPVS